MIVSDISPRTQAYADRKLLVRAIPNNILGQFGQVRPVPKNKGTVIVFRRYNKLAVATVPLSEGVTPTGKVLTKTDITARLNQYGDWVMITDVVKDTHEDPVINETSEILGEQAGETWDVLRAGILKAGTNVLYANGTARSDVNTVISKTLLRKAERALLAQHAKPLRSIIQAGPKVGTSPIAAAFIAVCHTDLKMDLEALADWTPVNEYPSTAGLINGEMGSSGAFRFVGDNNVASWADSGGEAGSMKTTSASNADVYPVLVFGKDAYGLCPLAGNESVKTYINNPKATDSDPLAQRGTYGWKGWTSSVILNDLWMIRLEVAVTA